ncbi:hypothetical protein XU18_4414 [Perkinsela sp. CCAP 1560/4]|nr:hypothetical protein XU18_4414 [Perkinsela sp. CCAP 1560/4]|eukprot:KNH04204.1 hypothetical protein XU18_4414 [Perkinsela sp. CCAP 1560/4]
MGIKGKRRKLRLRREREEEENRKNGEQNEITSESETMRTVKMNDIHAMIDSEAMAKHRIEETRGKSKQKKETIKLGGKVISMQKKMAKERSARRKSFLKSSWSSR